LTPAALAAAALLSGPADVVLTSGRVYTVDPVRPWAEAVAIRAGRIVYVGDDRGAVRWIGPKTARHALGGRLVLPGLIDAHTHPGLVAGSKDFFLLPETEDKDDLLAEVARQARQRPGNSVLVGGYWPIATFDTRGPRREDLDRVAPDRPVILFDDSGHSQWVNSRTLAALGIGRDTIDPAPGLSYFVRDANGEPTGWVKENALRPHLGRLGVGTSLQAGELQAFLAELVSQGVVALFDAGNDQADEPVLAALAAMADAGRLPLRYHASVMVSLPDQVAGAVARLERLRARYARGRLRIDTVKLMLDGVSEIGTAAVLEPYADGSRGATLVGADRLAELLLELHAKRLDLHVHAVGDAATRTALDAAQAARRRIGGPLHSRITLCHLEVQSPADLPRFAALDVRASFTPHWNGGYFQGADRWLGRERYDRMYSVKPLLAAGAVVTFSSDITDNVEWKTGRANPFFGMQVAHTRREVGEEAPLRPPADEWLSLEELVRGYTRAAAFQLRHEEDLGSIEAGRSADLVLLERDLFEVPAAEIHRVKPQAVLIEGVLAHGSWP
jgi:hypothetical protein